VLNVKLISYVGWDLTSTFYSNESWTLHTTLDVEGNSIHYQQDIWWPDTCMRKLIAVCKYMMGSTSFHQEDPMVDEIDHAYLWNFYVCMYVCNIHIGGNLKFCAYSKGGNTPLAEWWMSLTISLNANFEKFLIWVLLTILKMINPWNG
jgi:hypothetical protein